MATWSFVRRAAESAPYLPDSPPVSIHKTTPLPRETLDAQNATLKTPLMNLFAPLIIIKAPLMNVFAPLMNVFAPLMNVFAPLTNLFAPLTNLFAPLMIIKAPSINLFAPSKVPKTPSPTAKTPQIRPKMAKTGVLRLAKGLEMRAINCSPSCTDMKTIIDELHELYLIGAQFAPVLDFISALEPGAFQKEDTQWVYRPRNFVTLSIHSKRTNNITVCLRGNVQEFAQFEHLPLTPAQAGYCRYKMTTVSQLDAALCHIRRAHELSVRGRSCTQKALKIVEA